MLITQLASAWVTSTSFVDAVNVKYSTVEGYFLQDERTTNATTFDYTATNFGLINRTYPSNCGANDQVLTQWQRFAREVSRLNFEAPSNVEYKVIFMGRHGEGYHNVAESAFGTPAWNCYWSLLDGNGSITWADADLTAKGVKQARVANNFWRHEIEVQKIPTPQSFYTSPMRRCLATANESFFGLDLPAAYPFIPTIKERFREGISLHTCDRRHNRTYIAQRFPDYKFEAGFTEQDELWSNVKGETSTAQDQRSKAVLDDVFMNDRNSYISITSHSGEIRSILRVLGHREFSLNTGAVIPVLVRAEKQDSQIPSPSSASWTVSPHCTVPPMTSISNGPSGGCVCPSSVPPVTTPLGKMDEFKA